MHDASSRSLEDPVLGMVDVLPLTGLRGIGLVTVPALTGLKGRSIEMESDSRLLGRISHLVVSNVVRNVG